MDIPVEIIKRKIISCEKRNKSHMHHNPILKSLPILQ
jgi:hypothetical protein